MTGTNEEAKTKKHKHKLNQAITHTHTKTRNIIYSVRETKATLFPVKRCSRLENKKRLFLPYKLDASQRGQEGLESSGDKNKKEGTNRT